MSGCKLFNAFARTCEVCIERGDNLSEDGEPCPVAPILKLLAEAVEVGPLGWSPFTESNRHTGLLQDWKQVEFWVRRA